MVQEILTKTANLDAWYRKINGIYLDRNFHRDAASIFAHLVEVMGGLSLLASGKTKTAVLPDRHIAKALAWWMALCGKLGIASVEDLVWRKFPYTCSYCLRNPHQDAICREMKQDAGLQWEKLNSLREANTIKRPTSLGAWQRMFAEIYPVSQVETFEAVFARFTEELGELAEALRAFPIAPQYIFSEAADVFAWLMHLENLRHAKENRRMVDLGERIEDVFFQTYPNKCLDCNNGVCVCPPILADTLGRIAHEIDPRIASSASRDALLSTEDALELFGIGERYVDVAGHRIPTGPAETRKIAHDVSRILEITLQNQQLLESSNFSQIQIMHRVENLATSQEMSADALRDLASAIAALPSEARSTILNFLTGAASAPLGQALIELVRAATG